MKKSFSILIGVIILTTVAVGAIVLSQRDSSILKPISEPTSPTAEDKSTRTGLGVPTAITARDQEVIKDGVIIKEVIFQNRGYIVVYLFEDGRPQQILGHSDLFEPGTHKSVTINVSNLPIGESVLVVMAHMDNGDNIYEFPGDDAPVKVDGAIVASLLRVTKNQ